MARFFRVTAYTFLALSGMYAWLTTQSGWRHYLGLGIFFFASIRIMVLLFPRRDAKKAGDCRPLIPGDSNEPSP